MPPRRILVIDDEEGMLEVCAATLGKLSETETVCEKDAEAAADRARNEHFDLVIADVRMPRMNGIELLRSIREHSPDVSVLMMTAFPSVETAVESMKLGAADYITKPFLPDDLLATVEHLFEAKRLREENALLLRHVERDYAFGDLVGKSDAMRAVYDMIRQLASTSVDVLICGETGTGKELVARSIHRRSSRSSKRFVPVDCGAIPEDLLESELFGHERGAFTGATSRSLGLLEFADRGTFFLDEIGELPPRLQAKLLRTLQERRLRRVGGTEEIGVDVRVISATSRDLDAEVDKGAFRSELFYRINVARIDLPPLRERGSDIPLLASHFLEKHAGLMEKDVRSIDAEAEEVLCSYSWPGNVRELENVIRRALALARSDTLTVAELPDAMVESGGETSEDSEVGFFGLREQHAARFERDYLAETLSRCEGDVSRAAREAKVPRGTFYRLLNKHDLNPDDFRD